MAQTGSQHKLTHLATVIMTNPMQLACLHSGPGRSDKKQGHDSGASAATIELASADPWGHHEQWILDCRSCSFTWLLDVRRGPDNYVVLFWLDTGTVKLYVISF